MLLLSEVEQVRPDAVTKGDVLLLLGNDPAAQVVIVADHASLGRKIWELNEAVHSRDVEDTDVFLKIIDPVVRFDPTSAISLFSTLPPSGSLLITPSGPAIYERPVRSYPKGTAIGFDGQYAAIYRGNSTPAFSAWEVGVMRGNEFVTVVRIEIPQSSATTPAV